MVPTLYEIGYIISYYEGDFSIERTSIPFTSTVDSKYHVVKEGDTLIDIAQKHYKNQLLWYIIADANPITITDVFDLTVNTTLLIPSLEVIQLVYG